MVYYGKGFTWSELYNMPVWLRSFYYKKTIEALERKKKDQDKSTSKTQRSPKIVKPSIGPKK